MWRAIAANAEYKVVYRHEFCNLIRENGAIRYNIEFHNAGRKFGMTFNREYYFFYKIERKQRLTTKKTNVYPLANRGMIENLIDDMFRGSKGHACRLFLDITVGTIEIASLSDA